MIEKILIKNISTEKKEKVGIIIRRINSRSSAWFVVIMKLNLHSSAEEREKNNEKTWKQKLEAFTS